MMPIRAISASTRCAAFAARILFFLAVLMAPLSPQVAVAAERGEPCAASAAHVAAMSHHCQNDTAAVPPCCAPGCPLHAAIVVNPVEPAPRAVPRVHAFQSPLARYSAPMFRFEDPPRAFLA